MEFLLWLAAIFGVLCLISLFSGLIGPGLAFAALAVLTYLVAENAS